MLKQEDQKYDMQGANYNKLERELSKMYKKQWLMKFMYEQKNEGQGVNLSEVKLKSALD